MCGLACAAGIDGYRFESYALGDIAIENVVRGELACSPRVAATLFQRIGFPGFSRAVTPNHLTTRELQVADLINRGCPTKEIAWRHEGLQSELGRQELQQRSLLQGGLLSGVLPVQAH